MKAVTRNEPLLGSLSGPGVPLYAVKQDWCTVRDWAWQEQESWLQFFKNTSLQHLLNHLLHLIPFPVIGGKKTKHENMCLRFIQMWCSSIWPVPGTQLKCEKVHLISVAQANPLFFFCWIYACASDDLFGEHRI